MTTDAPALARLEELLGRLLLGGVIISAVALVVGLAWYLGSGASPAADRMLTIGLICLMATPVLRVVVSVVEYVRMRDWFFVLTTFAVLAELAATLIYALRRA